MNDWKDFFYLSIGERRALILLLILIAIGLILLIWGDILYDRQQAAAPVATERTEPPIDTRAADRPAYASPPSDSRPRHTAYRRPYRRESLGERVRRLTDRRPHYPHREKLSPGQTLELNAADTVALQRCLVSGRITRGGSQSFAPCSVALLAWSS